MLIPSALLAAAVAAVPSATAPVTPIPAPVETIAIGAVNLSVPVPAGYCVPEGETAVIVAMTNAADTMNDTPLALVSCRPGTRPLADYYLFKASKQVQGLELSRPVLLAGLGPAFKMLDSKAIMDKVKSSMKDSFGDSVSLTEGSITPAGQDDVCGYLSGVLTGQANGQQTRLAVAVCLTSVNRKVVSINHYEPAEANRGQAAMLADVRAIAERMIAANEH